MCEAASIRPGPDALTSLAEADPELVLIADNGEQIAAFPSAIAALLSSTARLKLIVTSRVALRVRAEHVMPIRPLETSSDAGGGDAELLFVDRARQLRADIDLAGDDDAIVEICELAGGIPLAIEVAAGRLGHLTPLALLDRLRRQSVALLDAHGAVDLPDRQQSLRTVLDATSTLLTDGGAALAKGVCAVKGPISLDLIERTFGDRPDLIDHLDELVDASLVNGPDHAGRYRMPIPVAEYFAGDTETVDRDRGRILRAVLAVAEPLVSKVDQRGRWAEGSLLDDAAAVTVACDAAIAQRDADAGARLAVALRRYWLIGSRIGEALQFCRGGPRARTAGHRARPRAARSRTVRRDRQPTGRRHVAGGSPRVGREHVGCRTASADQQLVLSRIVEVRPRRPRWCPAGSRAGGRSRTRVDRSVHRRPQPRLRRLRGSTRR